jgi:hypothetical protein
MEVQARNCLCTASDLFRTSTFRRDLGVLTGAVHSRNFLSIYIEILCRGEIRGRPGRQDWRNFSLAGWRADQALAGPQSKLDRSRVDNPEWPTKVYTPGSVM